MDEEDLIAKTMKLPRKTWDTLREMCVRRNCTQNWMLQLLIEMYDPIEINCTPTYNEIEEEVFKRIALSERANHSDKIKFLGIPDSTYFGKLKRLKEKINYDSNNNQL